jgi:formylmethanofuran dehydrogenase subunit B
MGGAVTCPYCGLAAVDITCNTESVQRYLCTGGHHEFVAVDGEDPEPLIVLSDESYSERLTPRRQNVVRRAW